MAPTIFVGVRLITTTYVYGDPGHPDRPTSSIQSPAWTPEDQALLMGLEQYEGSLCECGQPITLAWHSHTDGWWETDEYVCMACSARDGKEVAHSLIRFTLDDYADLPPFQLGITTSSPT